MPWMKRMERRASSFAASTFTGRAEGEYTTYWGTSSAWRSSVIWVRSESSKGSVSPTTLRGVPFTLAENRGCTNSFRCVGRFEMKGTEMSISVTACFLPLGWSSNAMAEFTTRTLLTENSAFFADSLSVAAGRAASRSRMSVRL